MTTNILIIDDEDLFREDLADLLRQEGFLCRTAPDGEAGLELASQEAPDVVLCDLLMPGLSGIEVADRLASLCPETAVLLVTAFGTMETAVDAFRKGVVDYLVKPLVAEDLMRKVERCLEDRRLRRELHYLRRVVSEGGAGTTIIGQSASIRAVKELIRKVAGAKTTVLISGGSGTGKELVARSLHETGVGLDHPFMAVNCAALPRSLFESELFGHTKGSFTGAERDRAGYFELASTGTLFLDEIGELPLELQPKLLRAIESREVVRIGGSRPVPVDTRIVVATNRDLAHEVEAGRFREDLYYRVKVVDIHVPPLRDRREDIPAIVEYLVHRLNHRLSRRCLGVDRTAMQILMSARWRGNVRELENVLERAILLSESEYLGIVDLPPELTGAVHCPELSDDLRTAVRAYERQHIGSVLEQTGGNREEAARRLGINASTLYRRLKEPGEQSTE